VDRIACVILPEFSLQLLLQRHPDWRSLPVAVVDRDKAQGTILRVNERARKLRILPGMRYAGGLSLSADLRAGEVSEAEIAENVSGITRRLCFFSAEVEPSQRDPGVFWLGASGLSLLFPSLRKWAGLIRSDVTNAGFASSIAVGFSRFGSYATARTTSGAATIFEAPDAERDHVRGIPLGRLDVDPDLRDRLSRLGIATVGEFLALPGNSVRRRFGAEAHDLYRLAAGDLFAPLVPQPPQEPVATSLHLDYPESDLGRLMVVVERLLQELMRRLDERCESLSAIHIRLTFDNAGSRAERLQPATPTLDLSRVTELIRLRLGAEAFPCGVSDVEVELTGVAVQRKQGELFVEKSPRDLDAVARSFARLRAEFGDDAVVRAKLRDGHLPEARFEWEAVREISTPRPRSVRVPPLVRRFHDRPVVFSPGKQRNADTQLTAHIDDGSIRETFGPYVVSGGWWAREVHREYYFVRTANGRSLWLYYDRRRMCWFLHGEVE
jgi:protein ImuB